MIYHLVWITKYRKPVLYGPEALRIRELIREICKKMEVEILKGNIRKDHIKLLVSIPPHVTVPKLMQMIKGKTANIMFKESERFRQQFENRHLWARRYFSVGGE